MAKQTMQHQCSFCKRIINVRDQYDLPIYDPNTGFAICRNCIKEVNHFLEEHDAAQVQDEKQVFAGELDDILAKNKPHIIKKYLDESGQSQEDSFGGGLQSLQTHEIRLSAE